LNKPHHPQIAEIEKIREIRMAGAGKFPFSF